MAFATGYDYDIFVSYAKVDDEEPVHGSELGWVSLFVRRLEAALAMRLGGREKFSIYFDRRDLAGNHQLDEILGAVDRAALMLSIASPAYAERDWTKRELARFTSAASDMKRLFAVEYLPLDEGAQFPAPLDNHKRLKFWERDETMSSTAMPIGPDEKAFGGRVHDLAEQIKKQLAAMRAAAETARPAIAHAATVIADDAAKRKNGIVYLAQTTDDLEEERLQLRRYLDEYGYLTLPEADLPGGGEAFREAAAGDIGQADLYVHLLGPRAGRSPADLPEGYARAQVELARAGAKEVALWRHPNLDVDAVADERHRLLLSDEAVVACGLEQLKDEIRRRLEARHAKPREEKRAAASLVFINAIKNDQAIAKIAQQEFAARNMSVAIPLFEGPSEEVQQDLAENMRECDVLVFIYGQAPPTWVRGQLRQFSKIRPNPPAKLIAIFTGPPQEKIADLGFAMPNLHHKDLLGGWTPERIRKVIEEIDA